MSWSRRATRCACCILDKPHHYHQQQGLRAKTDRLDAMTIARVLLSGEARVGYIPNEQIATYREVVRLHTQSLARRPLVIRTRSRFW